MKIALVILHADPARGGAERYTFDLASTLNNRGHEVSLIGSTIGQRPPGVVCIEMGENGLTRLGRYRRFLDALDHHLAVRTYDVVHAMLPVRRCDVYHPHAGIAAEAIVSGHLKHRGIMARFFAAIANRLNPRRNEFARVERELLSSANPPVVLCLSEYVKGMVRRHYPALPPTYLVTLFNAVDLAKYDPTARPGAGAAVRVKYEIGKDAVVALMVAQDFGRKGLAETIMALGRMERRDLILLVVGKDNAEPFKRLAIRNGVDSRVKFVGGTDDVYSFYSAADFFVLPTRHDPCSLVVLEALAMGVPVISTRQNGACEIMTEGVHGVVLASADDGEGLVWGMEGLCEIGARMRMREACLALRPRLAWEAHLEAIIAVYADLASARVVRRAPQAEPLKGGADQR